MTFWEILGTIFISPLKLIFEIIFQFANGFLDNPGISIIVLSFLMNILVLPLYMRADAMQEEARDIENKLHKGVAHIKKTFSGDEKMMILQTYYRQNNYKPTDALKGSVSLLLEIPFFMAAYQFLSNLEILKGTSFGPIKDLGSPDGLLVIGSVAINVLPILMTLINVISSAIYLKGFPLKTKIQLYAMALFFLVFLYTSPSGLVFYWTLNNLFSLVKTIFYKLKNPKKVLRILISLAGAAVIAGGVVIFGTASLKKLILFVMVGLVMQIPLLYPVIKRKLNIKSKGDKEPPAPNKVRFILGGVFLTILTGVLIPSTIISASPQEFVDVSHFYHPIWYIISSLCLAAGLFIVWLNVFYWLATDKGKVIFERIIWILSGVMVVDYMFFGTNLGLISPSLQYENAVVFSSKEILLNFAVIILVAAVFYVVSLKLRKIVSGVLITAIIALSVLSVINIVTIQSSVKTVSLDSSAESPHFELSKDGQNVVVLMLDRAMGEYLPYIMNEKPELKEKFDGFTYYENTISYGGHTNFGVPALLGGYEYTPVEMNKRDEESLVSKHNEALKVMPVLFDENDFEVTVCDPPYANYGWISDLSIYDEYEGIDKYNISVFNNPQQAEMIINNNNRNFFCFSLMKTMPVAVQPYIYAGGTYRNSNGYSVQTNKGISEATGSGVYFMQSYTKLLSMNEMTQISEDSKNTFLFMCNDTTHTAAILKEPEYIPADKVDNREYDAENVNRFTLDGETLVVENYNQMAYYHTNMAALLQVGNWLDYLRENDVYDNTRIIIVSDHGSALYHNDDFLLDDGSDEHKNAEYYYPLFMVKDFNSKGFITSEQFMTNADVATIATKDIIDNPTNPFTGKAINSDEKTAHEQFVILSGKWDVNENNGNTYMPSKWASVSENLRDKENWKIYDEEIVLKEHKLP